MRPREGDSALGSTLLAAVGSSPMWREDLVLGQVIPGHLRLSGSLITSPGWPRTMGVSSMGLKSYCALGSQPIFQWLLPLVTGLLSARH